MDSSRICLAVVLFVCCFVLNSHHSVEGVCQANGMKYVEDADVRFALMLQLRNHESDSMKDSVANSMKDCKISAKGLQHYLTLEWLIDRINSYNNNTGYIPGVKIGYTSFDDCGEYIYSARSSVSFFSNSLTYSSSTCATQPEDVPHIAVIGPSSSSSSLTVSSLFKDHKIPIISPMATVAELSDKKLHPNFFRTVPSDKQQMTLIMDMLQQLKWTFIAVAYQNDEYGKSGRNLLAQQAKERGICIHKEELVLPSADGELKNSFEKVLESAYGNSIAVVIIADTVRADHLFFALETRLSSNKRGLHFILMDAVNTDVRVFKDRYQGQGSFSISTASSLLQMQELKTEFNEKFKQYKQQPNDDHHSPLIKEYMETYGHLESFVSENLDAFLPSTINAVMALVQSLKSLQSDFCDSDCLKKKIRKGDLMDKLKVEKVDYSLIPEDIIPKAFKDSLFSFSFDINGDIDISDSSPMYTIHSFDANSNDYKKVGSYVDGKMSLDTTGIRWLSPDGSDLLEIPTSMCAGVTCKDCQNNGLIPVLHLPGTVYIVGIFSLHETDSDDPFKCGSYRSIAYDAVAAEGFLFAIRKLRATTGIEFGAIGFDACYSQLRMTSIASDYFSDISELYSDLFPKKIPRDKIVGVVGCLSSGCTIPIANFFMPLKIPVVSYASSSPDLDDQIDFPLFLRTVPSDVYQAQVMVNIIRKIGWEYVGLLYVNNNYGAKGMRAFRNIVDAEGSGICAAKEIPINEKKTVDDADLFQARMDLTAQNVKVVVFFGIDTRFPHFIQNLEKYKHKGLIFLASEDWGINEDIKNSGVMSARGTVTLKLRSLGLESEVEFKKYLQVKLPSENDTTFWYREFLQNRFKCNFRGGFHNDFKRECSQSDRLSKQQVEDSVKNQRVRHVINAALAMGKGLKEVQDRFCTTAKGLESCNYLRSNARGVVEIIKKQTRREQSQEVNVFDKNGNGAIGYDVYNIQRDGEKYEYIQVGSFGPGVNDYLETDQLQFYGDKGQILPSVSAVCEQNMCNKCKHRKSPPPPDPKEPENVTVSDYRSSDILLISLVVVLILAIAVIVIASIICFKRKYNVISKKLEKTYEEQIYDQPVRQVYQGHMGTSLPFSDPNISPYVLSNTLNRDGVANPTFLSDSDRIESVSQVIANRVMNIDVPYSTSASGNITSQNSILSQASTYPISNQIDQSYGSPRLTNHLNDEYLRSETPVKPKWELASTSQKENSVVYTPIAASSMPLNATSLQASKSAEFNSDNVILTRGPDGQLTIAYLTSDTNHPPTNPDQPITQHSAQENYGPYSRAAAIQRQGLGQVHEDNQEVVNQNFYNSRPTHPIASNRESIEMMTPYAAINQRQIPYENVEMQNLNLARQDMNSQAQAPPIAITQMGDITMNQSHLLQYAIPTQILSAPITYTTAIPVSQPQVVPQHVPNMTNTVTTTNPANMALMDPALQHMWMTRASNQTMSTDDLHEGVLEIDNDPQMKGDSQRLYGYPESNSLTSIPDVISGKMPYNLTTPVKMKRDVSLDSIDLDTDTDIKPEVRNVPQKLPRTLKKQNYDATSQNSVISMV